MFGAKAGVIDRISDREMVDDLALLGREVEIAMHLVVEEGSDSGCAQAQRFGCEIQAMPDSARFEMRVAIASVTVSAGGAVEIADHGKCNAGVFRRDPGRELRLAAATRWSPDSD